MCLQAEKIPDTAVALPASADQPATVQSMSAAGTSYRVFNASSQWASCDCILGLKGQLCKHQIKVLQLQSQATARSIVRYCGSLAGSAAGGLQALESHSQQQQQPSQPCNTPLDLVDPVLDDADHVQPLGSQPEPDQSLQSKAAPRPHNVDKELQQALREIHQLTENVPIKDQLVVKQEALASCRQVLVALSRSQAHRDAHVLHPCEQFCPVDDGMGMSKARLKPFFEPSRGSSKAVARRQPVESFTKACVPAKKPHYLAALHKAAADEEAAEQAQQSKHALTAPRSSSDLLNPACMQLMPQPTAAASAATGHLLADPLISMSAQQGQPSSANAMQSEQNLRHPAHQQASASLHAPTSVQGSTTALLPPLQHWQQLQSHSAFAGVQPADVFYSQQQLQQQPTFLQRPSLPSNMQYGQQRRATVSSGMQSLSSDQLALQNNFICRPDVQLLPSIWHSFQQGPTAFPANLNGHWHQ